MVGYLFPTPGQLWASDADAHTCPRHRGASATTPGRGRGQDTYRAARASAERGSAAIDLVLAGEPAACDAFGDSCYLNKPAIAAQALRSAGHDRVAVVDIDAHHANGTQAIFCQELRRAWSRNGHCSGPGGRPGSVLVAFPLAETCGRGDRG